MPMPASRDRLPRPVDISTLLPFPTRRLNIIVDEPGLRHFGLSGYGFRNVSRNDGNGGSRENAVGVQRLRHGRGGNQQRTMVAGQDPRISTARAGGGRGRRTQLPSWYPRTPLRDITGIMRAIERRRAELGIQNPEAPLDENNPVNAQIEPEYVASTPAPTIAVKPAGSQWRMKADHVDGTSNSLTPQKLLESIDKVREAWLEEQRKVQRTPAAKRAEREQKMRVLMSMR